MPGIVPLSDLKSDAILAYILKPDENPLPVKLEAEYQRVVCAARMLDEYPEDTQVLKLMKSKYNVSVTQLRKDIAHAKELFKTEHTFDYDFVFTWMIKDQLELIRECKKKGDFKNWVAAKKVLRDIVGERPAQDIDPRLMMTNTFYVQINNGSGQSVSIPLDKIKGLSSDDIQLIQQSMLQPVDDAQAEEIFNS